MPWVYAVFRQLHANFPKCYMKTHHWRNIFYSQGCYSLISDWIKYEEKQNILRSMLCKLFSVSISIPSAHIFQKMYLPKLN